MVIILFEPVLEPKTLLYLFEWEHFCLKGRIRVRDKLALQNHSPSQPTARNREEPEDAFSTPSHRLCHTETCCNSSPQRWGAEEQNAALSQGIAFASFVRCDRNGPQSAQGQRNNQQKERGIQHFFPTNKSCLCEASGMSVIAWQDQVMKVSRCKTDWQTRGRNISYFTKNISTFLFLWGFFLNPDKQTRVCVRGRRKQVFTTCFIVLCVKTNCQNTTSQLSVLKPNLALLPGQPEHSHATDTWGPGHLTTSWLYLSLLTTKQDRELHVFSPRCVYRKL